MKRKTKMNVALLGILTFFLMSFSFQGCSRESVVSPSYQNQNDQPNSEWSLKKGPANRSNNTQRGKQEIRQSNEALMERYLLQNTYPQSAEKVFAYNDSLQEYHGGTMMLPNGTQFHADDHSIIPPINYPKGKDLTISMFADMKTDSIGKVLEFTFGPSGTQFSVPAEIRLDWSDLGLANSQIPKFYYIDESGNYILQSPDRIDKRNRKVILYVDHFSRYALAHSE